MPSDESETHIILENGPQLSFPSTAHQMHDVTTISQAATLLDVRPRNPITQMKPMIASKAVTRWTTSRYRGLGTALTVA